LNDTKNNPINDETIIQYLLGELSEEEQEPLDLALADEEFYERVLNAEEDLVDGYAQDRLPAARRISFEQRFLTTPEQRERVAMARAMYEVVIEIQEEKAIAAAANSPMTFAPPNDERITQYLLDEISFEDQEPIDLALANDDFYERVLGVEDDLIDRYAQDRLQGNQRQRFEQRFLQTPAQRERVAMARAMYEAVVELQQESEKENRAAATAREETGRPPIVETKQSLPERLREFFGGWVPAAGWAMAAVSLLLFAGAGYLFLQERRVSQSQIAKLESDNQNLRGENNKQREDLNSANAKIQESELKISESQAVNKKLEKEIEAERRRPALPSNDVNLAVSSASPPNPKGGNVTPQNVSSSLTLKRGANLVWLEFRFSVSGAPADYYEATISNERAPKPPIAILSRLRVEKLEDNNRFKLIISFPATQLPAGKYLIQLDEVRDSGAPKTVANWRLNVEYE
jgi:anti-sigma factor RsiW